MRGVLLPARGHGGFLARGRRPPQPGPGPPRPPRQLRAVRGGKAEGVLKPGPRRRRGGARRSRDRGASGQRAACAVRGRARIGARATAGPGRDLTARRAQPAERDGRRGRLPGAGARSRGGRGRPAHLQGRRPPPGAGRRAGWRLLRQRLQSDERGLDRGRAEGVRRWNSPDRRWAWEVAGLRPPGAAGRGALPGRVSDWRGGRGAGGRAEGHSCAALCHARARGGALRRPCSCTGGGGRAVLTGLRQL